MPSIVCSACAMLLLAACETETPREHPPPDADVAVEDLPAAASIPDTIFIEGQPHPVSLVRYDEPGVPFVTYFPEGDFEPSLVSSNGETRVQFFIQTGGVLNEAAFVSFYFPEVTAARADVEAYVDSLAAAENWRIRERGERLVPEALPWARERIDYQVRPGGEWHPGTAFIGEQEGRVFLVRMQYPPEYGDGFIPRAERVLRYFRPR